MKILKWGLITMGVLFFLWVFGIFFKIFALILGVFGGVLSVLAGIVFAKFFWVIALIALVGYLIFRKKKTVPQSHVGPDAYVRTVSDLDRRLDRLNDILSREH